MEALDTTIVLASVVTLLTFTVVYHQIKTYTFWSSRGIKGPTPFPFLGTSVYFFFKNRVELDQEWTDKYGTTYGIYEGAQPVLQISDRELINHVMIKKFSSFTDRNNQFIHGDVMKRWTFFSNGDHWANQRALITPLFTGNKMKNVYSQTIGSCMKRFLAEIDGRLKKKAIEVAGNEESYKTMDELSREKCLTQAALEKTNFSKDELMAVTLDVIARCFFSLTMDTYKDKSSEFFKRAYAFSTFDMVHFILWAMTPNFIARYIKIDLLPESKFEYFAKLSKTLVRERRGNAKVGKKDMIQSLVEAKIPDEHQNVYTAADNHDAHYNNQMSIEELDDIHKKLEKNSTAFRSFSEDEIAGQTTFFFLAGFETTSSSLSFCLYELGHGQDAQQEVYEEMVTIMSDGKKEVDYDDLMQMKKLEAFISESLRLHNPVTLNNRIVTASEGELLPTQPPVHLPKGTVITSAGLVCHRNPQYWKDPLKFDMTRFYPENKHKILSGAYHPFGSGPRNCAGMRFALLNLRMLLANLLLKYKVLPGLKNLKRPPDYKRHLFFLQLANTDFRLIDRDLNVTPAA